MCETCLVSGASVLTHQQRRPPLGQRKLALSHIDPVQTPPRGTPPLETSPLETPPLETSPFEIPLDRSWTPLGTPPSD